MVDAESQIAMENIGAGRERERAVEALREAERKYRDIFESSGEGIFQSTPDGRFITANPALAPIFGFESAAELINTRTDITRQHYVEPHKREEFKRLFEQNGFVRKFEYQVFRKDGSTIWISENVRAVRDNSGTIGYYEGTAQDITERKHAEDRLRESEERYRELFENAKDAIYVHDLDGRYTSVNRAAEKLSGYTRDEILGKNFADFFPAEQLKRVRESLCRKLVEQGETTYETEVIARDGRRVPVEVSSRLIYENGVAIAVQGTARDITERKRAEEALREAELKYRAIFENAEVGIFQTTPDGKTITANPALARMLGFDSPEELISERTDIAQQEYVDPAQREEFKRLLDERDVVQRFEYEAYRKDGSRIWISESVRAIRNENGTLLYYEGITKDITERKRAEAALLASERRYRDIFTFAPVGIYQSLRDGTLITANKALAEMLGYSSVDELLKVKLGSGMYLSEDERERLIGEHEARGYPADMELQWKRKDGSPIWIQLSVLAIKGVNGATQYWEGFMRDITARKRAEGALRQTEQQYESLVHSIDGIVWEADPRTFSFTFVSKQAERLLGYPLAQWLNEPNFWADHTHPDDLEWAVDFCLKAIARKEDHQFEYRMIAANGRAVWLKDNVTVSIMDDESVRLRGVMVDITERKQAEEELKMREAQLTDAQRLAHLGSWEWDLATNTVTGSDELLRIWGVNPREFGASYEAILQLVHPGDRESFAAFMEQAVQDHQPYAFEHRIIRPDATRRILQARGAVVVDEAGRAIRMFGTAQDITERKLAEDEIKATNDLLRALSAKLQSAREEEGARIARELHDELGSALTSLNWGLEEVDKKLAAGDQVDVSALREKIGTMTSLVGTTIDTVRRISSELRPSVLDDLGLVEAIEWQAQQFQAQTGIVYQSDCSPQDINLNRDQSTAVFRIFQEALTNILRHAEATRFTSTIKKEAGDFVLIISDDGKGIAENEISRPQSLGLLGMRERAHLIGGEIDISGAEGQGTMISVRVPMVATRTSISAAAHS